VRLFGGDVVEFLGLGLIDAERTEALFEGEGLGHQESDLAHDDFQAVDKFVKLRVALETFQVVIAGGDEGSD
jgi:hypothetical protein